LYKFFIYLPLSALFILSLTFCIFFASLNIIFFIPLGLALLFLLIFYEIRKDLSSHSKGRLEEIEGRMNLLQEDIRTKKEVLGSLSKEDEEITFLFDASQNLIELIDPAEIFSKLANILGKLFQIAESILIYDLNRDDGKISLVNSLKRSNFVVKEKRGDVLDSWVLRQNKSLLIEDIKKDFRFDYERLNAYTKRGMHSFLLSPLSIGDRVLGVARIEAREPMLFGLEDSRILRNICDLAAVVLERANLVSKTKDLAIKDSLTNLFLRNYFLERLDEELVRIKRKNLSLGILMLDIDDFKNINDTYGHAIGDLVLVRLAKILRIAVGGAGNLICRFGGEEFMVSLVECTEEDAASIAEQIRKTVEQTILTFRRKKISFTISGGIAIYPKDGNDILQLIKAADKRLYKAKSEGKNKICFSG